MSEPLRPRDLARPAEQLAAIPDGGLPPLPHPYEDWPDPGVRPLSDESRARLEHSLDGVVGLKIPRPDSAAAREAYVEQFLAGLDRLLDREANWTFLQPLVLSLENCVKCNTCADACPIYESSGRNEVYRPLLRAETLRRLVHRRRGRLARLFDRFAGNDVAATWETVVRLADLSYRCTLCRRCAQSCAMGVDNGLIAREIRKLFSQELGWAPDELHRDGTVKQLVAGSSTGMNPAGFRDTVEFAQEEIAEQLGMSIEIPVDRQGADILVLHNAGEFLSWPENLQAFAILFDRAGLSWTLSSEIAGYDSVNYGLFYDDVQLARVGHAHAAAARKLGVRKVVIGECGHAHKAAMAVGDRTWLGEDNLPRESCFTLIAQLLREGRIELEPGRNPFPVTLHDPCNVVRSMGIVEPQREVIRAACPRFREMTPHGVDNYCCGGGSGFAVMSSLNFPDWRMAVAGRKKFAQILDAFAPEIDDLETPKYVCAPCSNCKGQIRDLLDHYQAWERARLHYGGLAELVVNALKGVPEGFLDWDEIALAK
ncbi:MAG TPA: (Fe-S)-binding protein [Candidatus Krumholzibacteria bacterium]|nr:(Fe-S)-binding protein [Candidatus Krumholzibacteria bacterium]HPD71551.1 (Fe-S)-binding protein [Candidatus Krumholzibacteria bacterium]HRY41516.1 (Fe-S)-binding protein [Candidatus Krumholzibacteria bacterium]